MSRLTGWRTCIPLFIPLEQIQKSQTRQLKILSFAGAFGDMNETDYNDFFTADKRCQKRSFDRDITI
jgi:hypothetical protein